MIELWIYNLLLEELHSLDIARNLTVSYFKDFRYIHGIDLET